MTSSSTPIETKIALLLAKAESTNVHEAEALTAAVEKLMIRYGIEQATIDAMRTGKNAPVDTITKREYTFTGVYGMRWVMFVNAIGKGMGNLQIIKITKRSGPETVHVIGYRRDLDIFNMLLTSLQQQAVNAQKAWWKTYPLKPMLSSYEKTQERGTFLVSFAIAVGKRLREERTVAVSEAEPGTGLVLANRGDAVKEWAASTYGDCRSQQARLFNNGGQHAGYTAGQNATTTTTTRIANRHVLGA